MTTWFTSDLHLGHSRIIELSGRPFADVDEMNRTIIRRWNERVDVNDTVYVLGDMVMGRFAETVELVRELRGDIFLVPGNHDRVHPAYQDTKPHKVARWRAMYEDVGLTILPPLSRYYVGPDALMVQLCHFPYDKDDLGRDEYDAHRPEDHGGWLLHGHVHERYATTGRQINVGVDAWGFAPINEDQVLAIIEEAA